MKQLSTMIVDDEPLAVALLNDILKDVEGIDVVGESFNGREAIAMARNVHPELIFLDIQMPGVNGFEVVKALQADIMPLVIFVTAFDQYAIDAFDLHAVDYVLKPLDSERVERAILRARDRISRREGERDEWNLKAPLLGAFSDIAKKVEAENKDLPTANTDNFPDKLVIKDAGVVHIIPFEDISWVDAAGDYMCVHAAGQTYILRSTMKQLMMRLDHTLFIRVHRSTVVNIRSVVKIKSVQKGGSLLCLKSGEEIRVSRNYRQHILSLFS